MIIVNILLLILGFAMLIKGADWFVDGTSGIANKLGIPQLVIGLTIVAMGTSAPEAAVSINAALKDNADITIGNVLGSNILNVLVILGITGAITAIAIQKSTLMIEIPFMLAMNILLLVMGMMGNSISRLDGIIFIVLFVVYLIYLFILAKKGEQKEVKEERSNLKLVISMIVGAVIVVWGSDVTVDNATAIAKVIGLSERFIGLTIVALGTSLPELVTSVTAAKKGNADIAIGNIVGSNIFNILFVIGISSLIIPINFASNFIIDASIAIFSGIFLWISVIKTKKLTRPWAVTMIIFYAAYLVYLLI